MSLRRAWEPTCDEPLERSLQISLRITFWDNSGERSCLESVFSTQSSRLGRLSLFHWSNNLSKSEKFLWPGWFSPRRNLLWHVQVHARLMCKGAGCARGVCVGVFQSVFWHFELLHYKMPPPWAFLAAWVLLWSSSRTSPLTSLCACRDVTLVLICVS